MLPCYLLATLLPCYLIPATSCCQVEFNDKELSEVRTTRQPHSLLEELEHAGFFLLQNLIKVDDSVRELVRQDVERGPSGTLPLAFEPIFNEQFDKASPGRRQALLPAPWQRNLEELYRKLFLETIPLFGNQTKVEVGQSKVLERRAGPGDGLPAQARHCDGDPGSCLEDCLPLPCSCPTHATASLPRYHLATSLPSRYLATFLLPRYLATC